MERKEGLVRGGVGKAGERQVYGWLGALDKHPKAQVPWHPLSLPSAISFCISALIRDRRKNISFRRVACHILAFFLPPLPAYPPLGSSTLMSFECFALFTLHSSCPPPPALPHYIDVIRIIMQGFNAQAHPASQPASQDSLRHLIGFLKASSKWFSGSLIDDLPFQVATRTG